MDLSDQRFCCNLVNPGLWVELIPRNFSKLYFYLDYIEAVTVRCLKRLVENCPSNLSCVSEFYQILL